MPNGKVIHVTYEQLRARRDEIVANAHKELDVCLMSADRTMSLDQYVSELTEIGYLLGDSE